MEYTKYQVTIEVLEDLLGGSPKNKAVYAKFIATKAPKPEDAEDEVESVQEKEEKGWTGFPADEDGPHLFDYQIKGYFCEAARMLKQFGATKQLQDKVKRYLFVGPRKIRLPALSGVCERPLRAQTAQGPRVTVTRSDVISAPFTIQFTVTVLDGGGITGGCLSALLDYGQYMGLGQWRSGGFGRFRVVEINEG